jgi:SAM-dependent methyltransferase
MVNRNDSDAFGAMLLEQHRRGTPLSELIERDDNFIDFGARSGLYIKEYRAWSRPEKQAIKFAKGRVLDVGCGAGRHSIYLQEKGLAVTGIDQSPGAIRVAKLRGLKKGLVRPIEEISKFKPNSFDTILMLGNNFGLFGDPEKAKKLLADMDRITTTDARIIAGSRDPYATSNRLHLDYHKLNRSRGRLPGQLRIRVRFTNLVGPWFDYLLASPREMESIVAGSGWRISKIFDDPEANYLAVLEKTAAV